MNYRHVFSEGQIIRQGKPWITVLPRGASEGQLLSLERRFEYRFYGPFGQGYHIGIFEGDDEIETLEYHWRDGAFIHPKQFDIGVWREQTSFTRKHDFGHITVDANGVSVEIDEEDILPLSTDAIAMLTILDAQYPQRIGIFKRA